MKTIPAIDRYFNRLVELKSNKPVSQAATELVQLVEATNHAYWEVDAYHAPSECNRSVERMANSESDKIAKKYGFLNLDILLAVIEKRTSYRWVYFSGISQLASN